MELVRLPVEPLLDWSTPNPTPHFMNTKPKAVAHTPLPWRNPEGSVSIFSGQGYNRVKVCDTSQHAKIADSAVANAQLIVRAVNSHAALVSACERLLSRLHHYNDCLETCDIAASDQLAMEQAESALALAHGTKEIQS